VLSASAGADALIMAAAVSDFRPAQATEQKIKKKDNDEGLTIELARNPDILLEIKAQREATGRPLVVVGFAAESENLLANAQAKLESKGLDLLAANDISASDAGFAADTNRVTLLSATDEPQPLDLTTKTQVSEIIIRRVADLLD